MDFRTLMIAIIVQLIGIYVLIESSQIPDPEATPFPPSKPEEDIDIECLKSSHGCHYGTT